MQAKPQKEHEWLEQLVGEWASEAEATMEPGQPPSKFKGSESVRSLGGLWVVAEGQAEMPDGGVGTMIMPIGYDPERKRYVGTWVGSMMSHLWVYDGALDASGRVLTLDARGPDAFVEGRTATFQDVIEIVSADHRVLRSRMLGDDGTWREFMTAHYRRRA
jgi:hypothetical protein